MQRARAIDQQAEVTVTLGGEVILHVEGSQPDSPWWWPLQFLGIVDGAKRSLGFVRFQANGTSLEKLALLAQSARAIHPRIDVVGAASDGSPVLYIPAGAESAAEKAFVWLWLQRLGLILAALVVFVNATGRLAQHVIR